MFKKLITSGLLSFALLSTSANAIPVDLELQLLADVSGSVDAAEYALQLQGYQSAFQSPLVHAAIANGAFQSIAVQYIEWSGAAQQSTAIDWFHITSAATSNAFAAMLGGVARAFSGATAPGSAINYGAALFANNGFEGTRNVMDVSGDGQQNNGANTANARDAALLSGVDTINGITIGNAGGLSNWYINNVIGGTNAFHSHAANFSDFTVAIEDKLIREVTGIPEPASIAMLALGLLGLVRVTRKT